MSYSDIEPFLILKFFREGSPLFFNYFTCQLLDTLNNGLQ